MKYTPLHTGDAQLDRNLDELYNTLTNLEKRIVALEGGEVDKFVRPGVAVATTGATNSSPYGYTTAAQADGIVTLVNQLKAAVDVLLRRLER